MSDFNSDVMQEMPRMRRVALRLCRNREDAEDLVQDCVLRALERKHLFQPGSNLGAWLATVMFRLFLSSREREGRRQRAARQLALSPSWQPASQMWRVQLRQLSAAVDQLSDGHRAVLFGAAVEGERYSDVADRLGLPVGTVRSRLSRSRTALEPFAPGTGANRAEEPVVAAA